VETDVESDVPAEKLKPLAGVTDGQITPDLVALARWLGADVASTTPRALGLVSPPPGKPRERYWATPVDPAPELTGRALTAAQQELLDGLRVSGTRPAGDELSRLRALEKRGLVKVERSAERRTPAARAVGHTLEQPPELTVEQTAALARIAMALDALPPATAADGVAREGAEAPAQFLLHGVTGSGKTEVYLRAAELALTSGHTVLVLVPEIGLAPQLLHRFRQRFGDIVAVLHSGLAGGERRDEWWRAASGEARIVVGARSAVFAPLEQLGLVIVDEEHDSAYKHDSDPRYDARRVAAWRARHAGAVLVCGSATPRPESVQGLETIWMRERVDGRAMPPVELLDMRGEAGPLHPTTREALVDARKSIVLLNRRGWSNFLECRDCGHVWECPNCDVSLVLHRGSGALVCHHCGHREAHPSQCPACGSVSIARHGLGTERLAEELAALDLNVLRVDADVPDAGAILAEFGAADRAVLVGTQLVAKGHDFPDVELGVVLDADATLRFPDLRSEERTFQLITQLAGRAGRGGDHGGRVLVQTSAPEHPAILAAATHDAEGFLAAELARREEHSYPPFATMARVIAAHPDQLTAQRVIDHLVRGLRTGPAWDGELLGPAPLFRLRGRERMQLMLKATSRAAMVRAIRAALDPVEREAGRRHVQLTIDIAPQ
jgi:primosomal protein N' (replication factor Y)